MHKKIVLLFAALLTAVLFGSCVFFEAVGHGIAALFFFAGLCMAGSASGDTIGGV
jgi:hypothetical protein